MPLLTTGAGTYPLVGGGADSAAYTNFVARTSGLDATHLAAYKALLDGLTTDGLFDGSGNTTFFDALYIFATEDSTTALLNLCGTNFTAGNPAPLTFTTDRGFTGAVAQSITTNFNPTTAISPNFVQNSAHISVWNLTNGANAGADFNGTSNEIDMYVDFSGSTYARVNDASASGGFTTTDPRGHILGNRSSSTARQLYQNASTTLIGGTAATYGSVPSKAPTNATFFTVNDSSPHQLAMTSFGRSLNSTQISNFYSRLRTYMTAIGVP